MSIPAPRVSPWLVVHVVAIAACATASPPRPVISVMAPAPAPPPPAPAPPAGAAPGAPSAANGGGAAATPFQVLLAREASGLGVRTLAFAGGSLAAEVEAAAAPSVTREATGGLWSIAIPIGSEAPISCFVYDKAIDTAASVLRFIRLVREGSKDVTIQSVAPVEAGAIGETPYLMVDVSYTKGSPAGLLGGLVKMIVRPDTDAPLLCFHDEVGYRATFKRVTQGLARALKVDKPTPSPELVEIQITRLGELPVGFDRRTVTADARGGKVDQTIGCMLMPRSPQEAAGSDHLSTEVSDEHGRLLALDVVEAEGEEIETQVNLTREGGGRAYRFKGKHAGKEISGRFRSKEKEGLASALLVAERLRTSLLVGKSTELKTQEYHASLAPDRPVTVTYRRTGEAREVTMTLGQLEVSGRLDEHGFVEAASMPLGGMALRQERVLIRRTPP